MHLTLGYRTLSLDHPRVMGILNVTPDSFSDGGKYLSTDDALRHAEKMLDEGADIIDVGGESTRPGAVETTLQEELDRILPVIEGIAARLDVALSVDTSKPAVMRQAVSCGASMINDVFSLRREGALDTAASLDVCVCLMHMKGEPGSMQAAPEYEDLPREIIDFLDERANSCVAAGIDRARIVVDPGFGFGKNDQHNLRILAKLEQFAELELPLLVGLSRKRTLGNLAGRPVSERVAAGVAVAVIAATKGARIVRTHDVAATLDALKMVDAVRRAGQDT